jgi:hypothetical protein
MVPPGRSILPLGSQAVSQSVQAVSQPASQTGSSTRRTLAGHSPDTRRTLAGHSPDTRTRDTRRTLAGHSPDTRRTLAGHSPDTRRTLAGHSPDTRRTLAGHTRRTLAGHSLDTVESWQIPHPTLCINGFACKRRQTTSFNARPSWRAGSSAPNPPLPHHWQPRRHPAGHQVSASHNMA